jgi:hypothetical protein
MGFIRTLLSIGTGGAVADRSRKQRVQAQILAATQGKSEAEVGRAGARHPHSLRNARAARKPRGDRA